MDSFRRAYRDPKSPLTPLTPLASNAAFNFNMGGDDSLKPFINVIDAVRIKGNARSSSVGLASGKKYVNPNKYTKPQPTQLNTRNVINKGANKARRLSPRCASNVKPDIDIKQVFKVEDDDDSEILIPKYDINNNSRQTSAHNSATSSSVRCTSNYGYANETGTQSSSYDSNLSNGSCSSFGTGTSTSSCLGGNRRRKPPKLVLNDTALDVPDVNMSSVFNWVWNRLSPMKNPSIYELLARVGMQKYWNIFEKEEIVDLDVFSTLTIDDLKSIGIKDTDDCVKILKSVAWALDFLSGLLNFKKP